MSLLAVRDLHLRRGGRAVLRGASFAVGGGEVVGLLGPNGSGKTTLLRAALGLLPAHGVSSLAGMPPGRRALHAAWLPQQREIAWPVPVRDVVALGRLPHGGGPGRGTPADRAAIDEALARCGLSGLAARAADALSGGEQARLHLARALAQATPLLLADEPLAGLDPAQQHLALDIFRGLAAEGRAVLFSLHDVPLALRCDRVLLMQDGALVADGPPREVLNSASLAGVFGIRAEFRDEALAVLGLAR